MARERIANKWLTTYMWLESFQKLNPVAKSDSVGVAKYLPTFQLPNSIKIDMFALYETAVWFYGFMPVAQYADGDFVALYMDHHQEWAALAPDTRKRKESRLLRSLKTTTPSRKPPRPKVREGGQLLPFSGASV